MAVVFVSITNETIHGCSKIITTIKTINVANRTIVTIMARLPLHDHFDPDSLRLPVIGIASNLGHRDTGFHQHAMGQLLFTQKGCIRIRLTRHLCMLPPTRVAWIPPYVSHRVEITKVVDYRSIYLDARQFGALPEKVEVLEATPLLRAVLERIATANVDTDWRNGPPANLMAVCLDEIRLAQREPTLLPLPSDSRLARISAQKLPPLLKVLATQVGASEKTIGRIFQKETGLSYQQWRQQWRFLKAIELLAQGERTSIVANVLEFSSDSAFVAFFRQMTGLPPRTYMLFPKKRIFNDLRKSDLP